MSRNMRVNMKSAMVALAIALVSVSGALANCGINDYCTLDTGCCQDVAGLCQGSLGEIANVS